MLRSTGQEYVYQGGAHFMQTRDVGDIAVFTVIFVTTHRVSYLETKTFPHKHRCRRSRIMVSCLTTKDRAVVMEVSGVESNESLSCLHRYALTANARYFIPFAVD